MSDPAILPLGTCYPMDAEGYVLNRCAANLVDANWQDLISEVVKLMRERWQDQLIGVYIRGSVAAGTAVAGVSDLDAFAMLKLLPGEEFARWEEADWAAEEGLRLQKAFPVASKVELMHAHHDPDVPGRNPRIKMILASQSLCVHGKDLVREMPRQRPGKSMCLHYRWLESDMFSVLGQEKASTEALRSWIKVMVRTGFEVVMEREGQFATDLYPCWKGFARHYPEQGEWMEMAIRTYLQPEKHWPAERFTLVRLSMWLVAESWKQLESH